MKLAVDIFCGHITYSPRPTMNQGGLPSFLTWITYATSPSYPQIKAYVWRSHCDIAKGMRRCASLVSTWRPRTDTPACPYGGTADGSQGSAKPVSLDIKKFSPRMQEHCLNIAYFYHNITSCPRLYNVQK